MDKILISQMKRIYIRYGYEDLKYYFETTNAEYTEVWTGDISDEAVERFGDKKLFKVYRNEIIKGE